MFGRARLLPSRCLDIWEGEASAEPRGFNSAQQELRPFNAVGVGQQCLHFLFRLAQELMIDCRQSWLMPGNLLENIANAFIR